MTHAAVTYVTAAFCETVGNDGTLLGRILLGRGWWECFSLLSLSSPAIRGLLSLYRRFRQTPGKPYNATATPPSESTSPNGTLLCGETLERPECIEYVGTISKEASALVEYSKRRRRVMHRPDGLDLPCFGIHTADTRLRLTHSLTQACVLFSTAASGKSRWARKTTLYCIL